MKSLVLFQIIAIPSVAAQGCTMCADGSMPSGKLGNEDCDALAETAFENISPDSSLCLDLQTRAFQFCNCPTLPEGPLCSLCENDFFAIPRQNRAIPGFDSTCGDILFANEAEECERNARASFYCGCPNETRPTSCSLCSVDDAFVADEIVVPMFSGRRVPPSFEYSCMDMKDAATLYDEETCGDLTDSLPVDLPSYCGCSTSEAPTEISCRLCDAGETLLANVTATGRQTCGDMDTVTSFVIDPQYCDSEIAPLRAKCCESQSPGEGSQTAAPVEVESTMPTISPVMATEEPTSQAFIVNLVLWRIFAFILMF